MRLIDMDLFINKVVERLEEMKHQISLGGDELYYYQTALDDAIETIREAVIE